MDTRENVMTNEQHLFLDVPRSLEATAICADDNGTHGKRGSFDFFIKRFDAFPGCKTNPDRLDPDGVNFELLRNRKNSFFLIGHDQVELIFSQSSREFHSVFLARASQNGHSFVVASAVGIHEVVSFGFGCGSRSRFCVGNCSCRAIAKWQGACNVNLYEESPVLYRLLDCAPHLDCGRGEIFNAVSKLMGPEGAKGVESFVQASSEKHTGLIATLIGVATLLIGSTTMFAQLQDTLNQIWKVRAKPSTNTIWSLVRQRLLSFSLILVIGFLLLVSLVASAVLAGIGKYLSGHLWGGEAVWHVINGAISFGVSVVLFGAIYKILPDVKLRWTYYAAAILLFGAECTRFRAIAAKSPLELKTGAEWINPESTCNRMEKSVQTLKKSA